MKKTGSLVIGTLFALTIVLILLGIIMVLSSSQEVFVKGDGVNVYENTGRQLMFFAIGTALLGFFSAVDYNRWENYSRVLLIFSIILLALVLTPLGHKVKGAQRWLDMIIFKPQPSEFAKLAIIFYLSSVWAGREDRLQSFFKGVFFPMTLVGFTLFLIILEPDNGTVFFIGMVCAVIWFVAGGRLMHLVPALVAFCAAVLYAIYTKPHLFDRIKAFLNPDQYRQTDYFQVWQSLIGFAYGGTWGAGLGEGRQQLGFTPEAHTDFIFSIMGEELGFVKCSLVLIAFLGIVALGYLIAIRCTNPFGSLVATGCTTAIGLQAAINIAVVTGSIPTTGIALPFLSYGGSSLMVSMAMVGLLISIARETFVIEARPARTRRRSTVPQPAS